MRDTRKRVRAPRSQSFLAPRCFCVHKVRKGGGYRSLVRVSKGVLYLTPGTTGKTNTSRATHSAASPQAGGRGERGGRLPGRPCAGRTPTGEHPSPSPPEPACRTPRPRARRPRPRRRPTRSRAWCSRRSSSRSWAAGSSPTREYTQSSSSLWFLDFLSDRIACDYRHKQTLIGSINVKLAQVRHGRLLVCRVSFLTHCVDSRAFSDRLLVMHSTASRRTTRSSGSTRGSATPWYAPPPPAFPRGCFRRLTRVVCNAAGFCSTATA